MSNRSGEVLYVKGLNLADSEEDETDIWDDTKLNEAYDKAYKMANIEVAKQIAMATNSQEKDDKNIISHKTSNKKGKEWEAGMPCRAVYQEDGKEYEAFVFRIVGNDECIVKFLGYNNCVIVPLKDLKPSYGKEARSIQIEKALKEEADEYSTQDKMDCSSVSTDPSSKKQKNRKKSSASVLPDLPFSMPNLAAFKHVGSTDLPIPCPPPPTLPGGSESEDQTMSSMLLAWYMSGYYTGLYQGMKRSKEQK